MLKFYNIVFVYCTKQKETEDSGINQYNHILNAYAFCNNFILLRLICVEMLLINLYNEMCISQYSK